MAYVDTEGKRLAAAVVQLKIECVDCATFIPRMGTANTFTADDMTIAMKMHENDKHAT